MAQGIPHVLRHELPRRGKRQTIQLDVLHAMMAGYPRDPELYSKMLAAMMGQIQRVKPLAIRIGGAEFSGYGNCTRLVASLEEAAKVYTESIENNGIYCPYMLRRCVLYRYGMRKM